MKYIYLAIFAGNMLIENANAVGITYTIGTQKYSQFVEFSSIEHKNSPVLRDALKSIVIGAYNKNGATDQLRAAILEYNASHSLPKLLSSANALKLKIELSAVERFNLPEADKKVFADLVEKGIISTSGTGKNLLGKETEPTWADIAGAYATGAMHCAGNMAYDGAAVVGSYALEKGKHYGVIALNASYKYGKAGAVAAGSYLLEHGKAGAVAAGEFALRHGKDAAVVVGNFALENGKAAAVATAHGVKTGVVAFGSWVSSAVSSTFFSSTANTSSTTETQTPNISSTETQTPNISSTGTQTLKPSSTGNPNTSSTSLPLFRPVR